MRGALGDRRVEKGREPWLSWVLSLRGKRKENKGEPQVLWHVACRLPNLSIVG
jgi:hypothetical protein